MKTHSLPTLHGRTLQMQPDPIHGWIIEASDLARVFDRDPRFPEVALRSIPGALVWRANELSNSAAPDSSTPEPWVTRAGVFALVGIRDAMYSAVNEARADNPSRQLSLA